MDSQTLTTMDFNNNNGNSNPRGPLPLGAKSDVRFTTEFSVSAIDTESAHEKQS